MDKLKKHLSFLLLIPTLTNASTHTIVLQYMPPTFTQRRVFKAAIECLSSNTRRFLSVAHKLVGGQLILTYVKGVGENSFISWNLKKSEIVLNKVPWNRYTPRNTDIIRPSHTSSTTLDGKADNKSKKEYSSVRCKKYRFNEETVCIVALSKTKRSDETMETPEMLQHRITDEYECLGRRQHEFPIRWRKEVPDYCHPEIKRQNFW